MLKFFQTLVSNRGLIKYLIIADLKVSHRNTFLGYLWWILDPLMMMVVYILLVVVIFKRGGTNFPVFLFCALLPWRSITMSLMSSSKCLVSYAKLIQEVNFPRAVIPVSIVLSNLIYFLFGLIALIPMLICFKILPSAMIFWLPVIVFLQLFFTIGTCLLFSCIGVYFRDFPNIMQFTLKIWFYLSPSLYTVSRVPEKFRGVYMLNPIAVIFTEYRNAIMYGKMPDFTYLALAFLTSGLIFIFGVYFFVRNEKKFARLV